MTLQESTARFVITMMMFAILCAVPVAGVLPSAIAQEDDEAENLASNTVSNVLDNGNTAEDSTNTQLSVPLTDQDQTDASFGLSEALDVTVERTLSTPTPPAPDDDGELSPPEEEPPEFAAFCYDNPDIRGTLHCYDTLEDCELGRGFFGVEDECEGVETVPPNAFDCAISRNPEGEPEGASCVSPPPI